MIDERAIIHPTAQLADDVVVGPWTTIGENVEIGPGCVIGPHVVIDKNTKMGAHNKVFQFASLGADPQHLDYNHQATYLEIGDHNTFREFVTVNRGTEEGHGVTRIGNHNYLMAYAHIAHDCIVNNHVIFANTASIAGHVVIADFAVLGAFAGVHQHVYIGAYSFLGRATKVYKDILPYMLVTGNPGLPTAINKVGLSRHGFSESAMTNIKKAFTLIHRRGLPLADIIIELSNMIEVCPELDLILAVIRNSKRGISR